MSITPSLTIIDILPHVTWRQVHRAIKYHYPKDKNDYSTLFIALKTYDKKQHTDKDECIEIYSVNFTVDGKIEESDCRYVGIHTNKYSMSFRNWKELANIPISTDTLNHYLFQDIIAHFIWEITYFGSEKEMKQEHEKLISKVKEIKKQS